MVNIKKVIAPKRVTPNSISLSVSVSELDKEIQYPKNDIDTKHDIDTTKDHITRKELEEIAGMELGANLDMYKKAFVHKSIEKLVRQSTEDSKNYMKSSNETLEFVGDSILGAVVADFLYRKFPNENEGFLTTSRTKIVKSKTLAFFAKKVGMADKILMGKQAIRTGGKSNDRFLEDAFEAFVGAIYYDKGFYGAQTFIVKCINDHFDFEMFRKNDNYKDIVLRYAQSIKITLPEYKLVQESGPPHNKVFTLDLILYGKVQGSGTDRTIKKAEQIAAKITMDKLKIDPKF